MHQSVGLKDAIGNVLVERGALFGDPLHVIDKPADKLVTRVVAVSHLLQKRSPRHFNLLAG
ncbi:MAG: hypothetical protein QOK02_2024 [Mycobacterium sp.]|nr:hypothetical protein [Mycobacterium sp.]